MKKKKDNNDASKKKVTVIEDVFDEKTKKDDDIRLEHAEDDDIRLERAEDDDIRLEHAEDDDALDRLGPDEPQDAYDEKAEENRINRLLPRNEDKIKRSFGKKVKSKAKKYGKTIVRLLIVAAIVAVISLVYINRDSLSVSHIARWISENVLHSSSPDFPVSISGSRVKLMNPMKNHVAVISDTSLMIINENGKFAVNRQHNLNNPLMKSSLRSVLTYEIGSNIFFVDNRNANHYKLETQNKILAADMNPDGYFAYATRSTDGYMSEFTVCNSSNQKIFRSQQSKYLITDISLSDDSMTVAVLMIGVENGDYVSIIKLFDLKSETPVEIRKNGVLFMRIKNMTGSVTALAQDSVWCYAADGVEIDRMDFSERLDTFSFEENGDLLLMFDSDRPDRGSHIIVVDSACVIKNEIDVEGEVADLDLYNGRIYVLFGDNLVCYDENGEYLSEWLTQGNAKKTVVCDDIIYISDNDMIYSYALK